MRDEIRKARLSSTTALSDMYGHGRGSQSAGTPTAPRGTFSGRTQPYPSSAKGPRANGPVTPTPRSIARDRWTKIFGGPTYVEAGPQNRLTLSLRSGLPTEIDWSLDRLLQLSSADPDLLRLTEHIQLLSALLALIQAFLDVNAVEPRDGGRLLGIWVDGEWEHSKRRATEAALVIRNLATEPVNLKPLVASKKLAPVLAAALELGGDEGYVAEETAELRLYLVEILEVVGESIPLALPTGADDSSPPARLFPLLRALTRSTDRALVLNAFRALISLSRNQASDSILALQPLDPSLIPHPIQTAIELLPIVDAELSGTVLDFIYQHTLLPANSALFCARSELVHILRLVCAKFQLGGKTEVLDIEIPMAGSDAETAFNAAPKRHKIRFGGVVKHELSLLVDAEKLAKLNSLPEPQRAMNWMRHTFEANLASEVTQVALWNAYRTQFERVGLGAPILPAADVIKMSSEAFATAIPMVTEERKFIIRGIRGRDTTNFRALYRCHWKGCPSPHGPESPAALYWHLHHFHLADPGSPQTACAFGACTYHPFPSSLASPVLTLNDLSLHVRTHMPAYYAPPGYGNASTPPLVLPVDGVIPEFKAVIRHERYHAQSDESGEIAGLGFLACLVLRNVARTIKTALGSPSGAAGIRQLAEEASIFEALIAASEGRTAQREESSLDKIDYSGAKRGAEALMSLERLLVAQTLGSHGFSKVLGEVLEVITACWGRSSEGK